LQAIFKVRGDSDISLIRKGNTLDEVNIFHDENLKVLLRLSASGNSQAALCLKAIGCIRKTKNSNFTVDKTQTIC
jgi:hypothetical protein